MFVEKRHLTDLSPVGCFCWGVSAAFVEHVKGIIMGNTYVAPTGLDFVCQDFLHKYRPAGAAGLSNRCCFA